LDISSTELSQVSSAVALGSAASATAKHKPCARGATAYHKMVLMVDVHESVGGVDVLATIKGPALPALLLSQLHDDFLADSHGKGS